jgi:hypothetical protein
MQLICIHVQLKRDKEMHFFLPKESLQLEICARDRQIGLTCRVLPLHQNNLNKKFSQIWDLGWQARPRIQHENIGSSSIFRQVTKMHQAAAAIGLPASILTRMSSSWLSFSKNKHMMVVRSRSVDLFKKQKHLLELIKRCNFKSSNGDLTSTFRPQFEKHNSESAQWMSRFILRLETSLSVRQWGKQNRVYL